MSEYPILDRPDVLAALEALEQAIERSCAAGGEMKRLTVIAHSTIGTDIGQSGCDCPNCIIATLMAFGEATGGNVHIVRKTDPDQPMH